MQPYRISENGRKLIEFFEGRKYKAYKNKGDVCTIGIGHTKGVKDGDTATDEQIDRWFYEDLANCEMHVNDLKLRINQNQFDALVSFSFNLGVTALNQSTLLKMARVYPCNPEIRYQFSRWVKAKDAKGNLIELPGLIKRRHAEAELYFTGNLELT